MINVKYNYFLQQLNKGSVTQRKRTHYAQITLIFSFLRVACVVCVIRRCIERGPSLIVSECASKAVCAWFEFWTVKKIVCVIHESAFVVHASSMRDYARDTRRPSVVMRRNCFETTHVHVRQLTPTFISRINSARITYIPLTFLKRACLDALRQWFVRRACVECSWNTTPYLLVCVEVHDMSVIRQWLQMIPARFMRDLCVIGQWFLSPTPQTFGQFLDAQTQYVRGVWVIRAWSVVWLGIR